MESIQEFIIYLIVAFAFIATFHFFRKKFKAFKDNKPCNTCSLKDNCHGDKDKCKH